MGRVFMDPLDDPFAIAERELSACPLKGAADAIVVDMHCEATSEKQAMGHFCDGRASLVVGTHTHAPTADHRVLPGGTAFITDVGMTGDYDSVIGMNKSEPLQRFVRRIPSGKFEPASGPATLCAVAVETDDATGLATPHRAGAARRAARGGAAGILGIDFSPARTYNARRNHPFRDCSGGALGRPFPIQEHHAPQGAAGRDQLQAVRQARARNHGRRPRWACPIPR